MEAKRIPANIDYDAINGLATQKRQRLKLIQPEIAQANVLVGWFPADMSDPDEYYIRQARLLNTRRGEREAKKEFYPKNSKMGLHYQLSKGN